jgi:hypothetical protein
MMSASQGMVEEYPSHGMHNSLSMKVHIIALTLQGHQPMGHKALAVGLMLTFLLKQRLNSVILRLCAG